MSPVIILTPSAIIGESHRHIVGLFRSRPTFVRSVFENLNGGRSAAGTMGNQRVLSHRPPEELGDLLVHLGRPCDNRKALSLLRRRRKHRAKALS